jgi:hypothetical protein
MEGVDTDNDGRVTSTEFQAAIDRTFSDLDKNQNGVIEPNEVPPPPMRPGPPPMGNRDIEQARPDRLGNPPMPFGDRPEGMAPGAGPGRPPHDHTTLPPFFFMDRLRDAGSLNKADFEKSARGVFASMDQNSDGSLSREEARPPRHEGRPEGAPPPPNAMFVAAELRFGDRLVKDQPFSAEIVIEDTRRLYDGSTVTKRIQGAIYRDTAGRTRREQPLEMVGGFSVVTDGNKAPMLVFINDFPAGTQYFLDLNNKVARKNALGQGRPSRGDRDPEGTSESLGKKTIEGVMAEGTRYTFEIPVGQMGNEKPLQVVTENWFSPELQMIVSSRHVDPLSGEHIFRLTNIKRTEPAAELFAVPTGFRIEN